MLVPKVSIALIVNKREVTLEQATEVLKAYGRSLQKATYREMVRLSRILDDWATDYDRRHAKPSPTECDGTILCNRGEGCKKRNCPAKTLAHSTYFRKWKAYNG